MICMVGALSDWWQITNQQVEHMIWEWRVLVLIRDHNNLLLVQWAQWAAVVWAFLPAIFARNPYDNATNFCGCVNHLESITCRHLWLNVFVVRFMKLCVIGELLCSSFVCLQSHYGILKKNTTDNFTMLTYFHIVVRRPLDADNRYKR